MPDRRGPRCPQCHAEQTERLPFTKEEAQYPVYVCDVCGHVWREAQPKPSRDKFDKVALDERAAAMAAGRLQDPRQVRSGVRAAARHHPRRQMSTLNAPRRGAAEALRCAIASERVRDRELAPGFSARVSGPNHAGFRPGPRRMRVSRSDILSRA